jgi:ATP-dependent Lon protease
VVIEQGLQNVKTILTENYVRPDEAEKVKSLVRERCTYKVIDRVTVRLNEKKDKYEASFSSLGIKDAENLFWNCQTIRQIIGGWYLGDSNSKLLP